MALSETYIIGQNFKIWPQLLAYLDTMVYPSTIAGGRALFVPLEPVPQLPALLLRRADDVRRPLRLPQAQAGRTPLQDGPGNNRIHIVGNSWQLLHDGIGLGNKSIGICNSCWLLKLVTTAKFSNCFQPQTKPARRIV